ncbi:MAG: hypothetical protein M1481_07435 [Candidatus Thermoplasmatota archaeon]|jgi:tRNA threonylcarbamoyladenosine modification (KEOPS) complex Cgi121 subunit|nr:hypothetical protein [Candidatus Thermoplasmatota archaeon]MCL5963438.1 hypothetical protein [Candidatus Thermoplasmatota archaeon]
MEPPKVYFLKNEMKLKKEILDKKILPGKALVMVDGEKIYSSEHLIIAFHHACRRWSKGATKSSSLSMETILFASLTLQIDVAVRRIGLHENSRFAALLVYDTTCDLSGYTIIEPPEITLNESFLNNLGLDTQAGMEKDQIRNTIIERMALLNLLQ